jgi:hypothetical protein
MNWFTAKDPKKAGKRVRGMYAASIAYHENNAQLVALY